MRYRCEAEPYVAYTCHCLDCQRITSSAFATCMQVPAEALQVVGEPASFDRVADSGNRLRTSFCTRCRSALVVANEARPRLRTIYVGTLDRAAEVEVDAHIFVNRKLPWVVLPTAHRVFPGAADWRPDYASDPSRLER